MYALVHQTEELVNQTMDSLAKAPFNKIRFCVFPKSYDYNHNDPQWYAFEKDADGKWDVHSPCFAFWDALEARKWEDIEEFVAKNDPWNHLLSCHNCFPMWDAFRKNITHLSIQSKAFWRLADLREKYHKPVVMDECCYEGNLSHFWGSISGREMSRRFWRAVSVGAYCTHGEIFLDPEHEILWWAKGGSLKGESPERIGFLRDILEHLPGPLEAIPAQITGAMQVAAMPPEQQEQIFGRGGADIPQCSQCDFAHERRRSAGFHRGGISVSGALRRRMLSVFFMIQEPVRRIRSRFLNPLAS